MNTMNRSVAAVAATIALVIGGFGAHQAVRVQSAMASSTVIGEGNVTSIPAGFRQWTFLGAHLTPNVLNGAAAGFPEFHRVYIRPDV
ncbi:MAG TPA: hypothetical protein PKW21_03055 [Rhabdaerophilum sp.]|nr:hypothetical protein [Rhabdaerophilum sp.]